MHQPRAAIFELFDRVMIMSKGTLRIRCGSVYWLAGEVAYHGSAVDAVPAFAQLGWEVPAHENPGAA